MRRRAATILSLAVLLVAGCASTPPPFGDDLMVPGRAAAVANTFDPLSDEDRETEAEDRPVPRLFPGTDATVRLPPPHRPVEVQGDAVTLNFVDAPLAEVVQAILGDLLELGYSIDGPLEGSVTLQTRSPVERDALPDLLDSLLRVNGAVMVQDSQGIFRIGPPGAVETLGVVPRRVDSLPPGHSLVIVPLAYVGAAEMARILDPVAPEGAVVRVDTTRNLLLLAGSRDQLEGWLQMVRSFDVDYLAGMSVGIFPLEQAAAGEVADALSVLLTESTGDDGVLAGALRVIPIERLNSLLVVTPRAHYLEQMRVWIERLDKGIDNALEPRLYVYPVQNGSATHLADLLNGLYGAGTAAPDRRTEGRVAPGLTPTRLTDGADGAEGSRRESAPAPNPSRNGGELTAAAKLGEDVRIMADERNNALLILAPRKDFRKIESALQRLDRMPSQVVIEASIIEVTLTDELRYGLEWFFTTRSGRYTGEGRLNMRGDGDIGPGQPGFSFAVTNPLGDIRAVLNALAERSLVNVLSNPTLMVLDNHTARIQVGDQQPVRSQETLTDGGVRTSSIEFRDTGVILEVTPSVNAGGLITLDVHQDVTDVGPVDSATGQRSFLQRNFQSRIAVRSGESIVLGGLIRDNRSDGRAGIPGLSTLPGLGPLFGTAQRGGTRTELLVMMTPRVIRDEHELRAVSEEIRTRMRGLRSQFGQAIGADSGALEPLPADAQ
ncbi:general secretion pathway protein D [Thioalkalivibrio paradoxus ARh 1]|uniref:General secretion pathway protein D n=1 Tax=Thioalkalivibrio paradoxus ARh 1 TaxID=713585 RepID=W0DMQ5_9GAMM|nr:general secretion pathway protein D [Thioalkalivibrio paradoxus ARh 1]